MTDTITTWGGRELPKGWHVIPVMFKDRISVCYGFDYVAEFYALYGGDKRFREWRFKTLDRYTIEVDLLAIFSIPPNAAPEYIAWCHERGIEVPGGEVQRVEVSLPILNDGVHLNNWEPPQEVLEFITGFGPVHLEPPHEIDKEFTWIINEDVTARLVLEMRP